MKIFLAILGCAAFVLGVVGIFVPLLPTTPFLLLAALGFAKSSERLHTWFTGTKLYKNNLESYVRGEGMTAAAKRRIMLTVTALMAVGFALMMRKELYILCIILACVEVGHFGFGDLANLILGQLCNLGLVRLGGTGLDAGSRCHAVR